MPKHESGHRYAAGDIHDQLWPNESRRYCRIVIDLEEERLLFALAKYDRYNYSPMDSEDIASLSDLLETDYAYDFPEDWQLTPTSDLPAWVNDSCKVPVPLYPWRKPSA